MSGIIPPFPTCLHFLKTDFTLPVSTVPTNGLRKQFTHVPPTLHNLSD